MLSNPEQSSEHAQPVANGSGRMRVYRPSMLCCAVAALSLAWLAALGVGDGPKDIPRGVQALVAMAALVTSAWVGYRQLRYWTKPVDELLDLLPVIQRGEAPIEELSRIGGGIGALVPPLQDLFREMREQKMKLAQVQHEISQRVASRTGALERTIGTLQQQAARDSLTGLYNRRMLDQMLPQLIARCAADDLPLCLVMMDVDHFKTVNDTLTHAEGDRLLTTIGSIVRSGIRERDMGFRYGGDEFVILMPGSDRRTGEIMAARLGSLVEAYGKTLRVSPGPQLSGGVAMMSEFLSPTAELMIQRADQMLYAAKARRKSGFGVAA